MKHYKPKFTIGSSINVTEKKHSELNEKVWVLMLKLLKSLSRTSKSLITFGHLWRWNWRGQTQTCRASSSGI